MPECLLFTSPYITIDSPRICVFVGLKKGVERTYNTVTEVIQKVRDAVMRAFGEHVVPYVSSEGLQLVLSKSFQSTKCFDV